MQVNRLEAAEKKALFSDTYQNRGLECSAAIQQVAPKTPLPAGPGGPEGGSGRGLGRDRGARLYLRPGA